MFERENMVRSRPEGEGGRKITIITSEMLQVESSEMEVGMK